MWSLSSRRRIGNALPCSWSSARYAGTRLWTGVEYRAEPEVKLHIVTDWAGAANEGSPFKEEALEVFDLPELIHERLSCMDGDTFMAFDLVESQTNHNHEEIVENIEVSFVRGLQTASINGHVRTVKPPADKLPPEAFLFNRGQRNAVRQPLFEQHHVRVG